MPFEECCSAELVLRADAQIARDKELEKHNESIEEAKQNVEDGIKDGRKDVPIILSSAGAFSAQDAAEARDAVVEASEHVQLLSRILKDRENRKDQFIANRDAFLKKLDEAIDQCREEFESGSRCSKSRPDCCPPGHPNIALLSWSQSTITTTIKPLPEDTESDTTQDSGESGSIVPIVPEEEQPFTGFIQDFLDFQTGQGNNGNSSSDAGGTVFNGAFISANFGPASGPASNPLSGQLINVTNLGPPTLPVIVGSDSGGSGSNTTVSAGVSISG